MVGYSLPTLQSCWGYPLQRNLLYICITFSIYLTFIFLFVITNIYIYAALLSGAAGSPRETIELKSHCLRTSSMSEQKCNQIGPQQLYLKNGWGYQVKLK
jgi:hypothetical protein